MRRVPSSMPSAVASVRSAPEQKTLPELRTSTTRTSSSAPAASRWAHELGDQLAAQRVAVVGAVEGDGREAVGDGEVDQLGGGVGHGDILPQHGGLTPARARGPSLRS